MGRIEKPAPFWRCEYADCRYEWYARGEFPPSFCTSCGRTGWYEGIWNIQPRADGAKIMIKKRGKRRAQHLSHLEGLAILNALRKLP